jgi:hypothetical protein
MSSTGKPGSVAPLCILCHYPMPTGGYLRQAGKPISYVPVMHCINNECQRYGLVSIVKQIGTGDSA